MTRTLVLYISIAILCLYAAVAVFAPLLTSWDPHAIAGTPLETPDSLHPLGTNDTGQDILSQLLYGTRITLLIGFGAAILSVVISTSVGLVIGYYGGPLDEIVSRIIDIFMTIPLFPLLLVLALFFNPNIWTMSLLMGVLGSTHGIRVVRSQVLSLAQSNFVEGARAIGASDFRIMTRHILPNIMPIVIVKFVTSSQHYLVMGVGLSFLGLWDTTTIDWGTMINQAYSSGGVALGLWWWLLPPGIAVVGISLALALIGYSFEEKFNPRVGVNRL
ncbi:MAG: ABC transporter permease [Methanoregulaceae archaeon]